MKIDWKKKLTSRKFWVSVAGLAAGIVLLCTGEANIEGVIMSLGSVVAYTVGEGMADAGR